MSSTRRTGGPRIGSIVVAGAALPLLCAAFAPAQETPPPPGTSQAPPPSAAPAPAEDAAHAEAANQWTFDLSALTINPPDDDSFVSTIVRADRDWLHLEGRWNYEALHTGSVFGGYNFEWGKELQLAATPMAGVVFGDVDGVAPAVLVDAKWKWLELYDESEYVVATSDHADSFFYSWNELTLAPLEWLKFGLVAQRTQAYDTRLALDRGLLLSLSGGPVTGAVYWFNPDKSDSYVTFSVAFSF